MTHIEWIESSKTWTCPKSGKYKVICVGGGASGGVKNTGSSTTVQPSVAGGTTSFGSILSAAGGTSSGAICKVGSNPAVVGGYGGWDGINYGGTPAIVDAKEGTFAAVAVGNGGMANTSDLASYHTTGVGYGAGGGAGSSVNYGIPGFAGKIKTTIVDIEMGETITCTIGAGGTKPNSYAASGANGVIVVQYLGA